jgi:hypothetical protein
MMPPFDAEYDRYRRMLQNAQENPFSCIENMVSLHGYHEDWRAQKPKLTAADFVMLREMGISLCPKQ